MSLFFNQDTAPSQLLPEQGPPGPAGPTGPQGPQGPAGAAGASTWDELTGKPTSFTPSTHKASHAVGGTDALTPADIGAATAAQGAKADTALQGNAPAVIDVNSANPALRVTQTGEGHAFVVEDSTHPDDTSFIITKDGAAIFKGSDAPIQLSPNIASHNRTGIQFFERQSTITSTWWLVQNLNANSSLDEHLYLVPAKGVNAYVPALKFTHAGSHEAGQDWTFTGNVAISGSLTASAIATAITSAAAPATSGSVGLAGSIRYDGDYIYICTATNTWRRTAVTSW